MPIIAYLGKSINEYLKKVLIFLSALEIYCPVCGEKMGPHDNYPRYIKDKNITILIYRFKCTNKTCNKTKAVLPDFLVPYKHYSADEIESVLLDSIDTKPEFINTPAGIATIRRWVRLYKNEADNWISKLKAILFKKAGKAIDETKLNRCHFTEQLSMLNEEFNKEFPAIKTRGNILGSTVIYIRVCAIQEYT